jgi:hypothetical protein
MRQFELGDCGTVSTVAASRLRPIDKAVRHVDPEFVPPYAQAEGACMRVFAPESKMFTLGGVFYPTGHVFLMFPSAEEALAAEKKLIDAGCDGGQICLLTPQDIHEKIAAGGMNSDEGLPSPGTEGATALHYEQLAREGHHALLVPAPSAKDTERVMQALKGSKISYAQKYRHFVIEDLVPDTTH